MAPDDTALPGGDWSFPAVEPAPPPEPGESTGELTEEPMPDRPPDRPPVVGRAPLPGGAPRPPLPGAVTHPLPSSAVPSLPTAAEPPPADPDPSSGSEEPPSVGVLPVPRRFPATRPPISPLRALAGAAVAVAGVLLGIGALLWATDAPKGSPALQQTQGQSSPLATSTPAASPTPESVMATPAPLRTAPAVVAPAAAPKPALTVLNNSNRNGLAKRAAARFAGGGWQIKQTGDFRGRISVTTVYYAPGQQAAALLLQKAFPAIQRVHPRFAGLPGSGLTVVLTRDYPG
jgi:hypothetical protein